MLNIGVQMASVLRNTLDQSVYPETLANTGLASVYSRNNPVSIRQLGSVYQCLPGKASNIKHLAVEVQCITP